MRRVVLFGLLILAMTGGWTTASPRDASNSASVIRVIDGDTILALIGGAEERVRLIGIDAPERGECLAEAATKWLTQAVGGSSVRVERDVSDRDLFGRLLRYVYAGESLVNRELVAAGLAQVRLVPPDLARATDLASAQIQAEQEQIGLWQPPGCAQEYWSAAGSGFPKNGGGSDQ